MKNRTENDKFFNKMIEMAQNGGFYFWPDEKETFRLKDGKMVGKKSAIRKIKNITTKSFHNRLVVK